MKPGTAALLSERADSSRAVDRTCPICERQEALVPFGRYQNLQPITVGAWRLVTVEIAQCRQCRAKVPE